MAAEDQTITAKFIADTAGFTAGAEEVISQSKAIEAATSQAAKGTEQAGAAMSSLGGDAEKAGKGTEVAATGLAATGKAGEEAGSGTKAAASNIAAVGTASAQAGQSAQTASAGIAATGKAGEEAAAGAGKAAGGFSLMGAAMGALVAIQIAQMIMQVVSALAQAHEAAQNTATAFTYLTGSADKAQQELKQLNDSWAAARFGTQNIDNVGQHLLMSGEDAKTAQKEIERVSDAVAAMGGSAQQIQPIIDKLHGIQDESKVTKQDMQQLVDDGLPAWQALADGMSATRGHLVTVAEAQKEVNSGAISGKEAYKDMMTGMQQYTGAAEQSSQSLGAEWDRLKGHAANAFGPIADFIAKDLDTINQMIEGTSRLNDALKSLGAALSGLGGISSAGLAMHASGITDSPTGHFAMVGEEGPELMYVPQGSSIFPNGSNPFAGSGGGGMSALPPLAIMGGGGPQTVELHIHMDSATIARQTIPLIAPQIRVLTGGRR
jgi:tape measure domain-containing protein